MAGKSQQKKKTKESEAPPSWFQQYLERQEADNVTRRELEERRSELEERRREEENERRTLEHRRLELQEEQIRVLQESLTARSGTVNTPSVTTEGNHQRTERYPAATKPSQLEADVSLSQFTSWRESWNDYALVQKIDDMPIGIQLAYLRSCMSACLLYTSPSPRDKRQSRMPSSA